MVRPFRAWVVAEQRFPRGRRWVVRSRDSAGVALRGSTKLLPWLLGCRRPAVIIGQLELPETNEGDLRQWTTTRSGGFAIPSLETTSTHPGEPCRARSVNWRRGPESNRRCSFCRAVPYHLATPPPTEARKTLGGLAFGSRRSFVRPRRTPLRERHLKTKTGAVARARRVLGFDRERSD